MGPNIKRLLVLHSSLFKAALKGLYESKVSFCAATHRDKIQELTIEFYIYPCHLTQQMTTAIQCNIDHNDIIHCSTDQINQIFDICNSNGL